MTGTEPFCSLQSIITFWEETSVLNKNMSFSDKLLVGFRFRLRSQFSIYFANCQSLMHFIQNVHFNSDSN